MLFFSVAKTFINSFYYQHHVLGIFVKQKSKVSSSQKFRFHNPFHNQKFCLYNPFLFLHYGWQGLLLLPSFCPLLDYLVLTVYILQKRTFKKFYFRGIDLDALYDLSNEQFGDLVTARARRRLIKRGLTPKYYALNKKLRKAVSIF